MNSKLKGDIGEANVIAHLLSKGYNVSIPFGDNTRYDLIYEKNNKFIRVQVKSLSIYKKVLMIKFWNKSTRKGKPIQKSYRGKIDEVWVYCLDLDTIYKIPVKEFEDNNKIQIRMEPPKNNQRKGIRFANHYLQ